MKSGADLEIDKLRAQLRAVEAELERWKAGYAKRGVRILHLDGEIARLQAALSGSPTMKSEHPAFNFHGT